MNLIIKNLYKNYGKKEVLKNINLEISSGIYGIVGPDGVGKTTLLRIIAGMTKATKGYISLGEEYISYLPHKLDVYSSATGWKYLQKALDKDEDTQNSQNKIEEIASILGLENQLSRRYYTYTDHEKRKLGIAQIFLYGSDVILLDEPMDGFDSGEKNRIMNGIFALSQEKIVLFTTKMISDVKEMSDKILFLKNGIASPFVSSQELIHGMNGKVWTIPAHEKNFKNYMERIWVSKVISGDGIVKLRILSDYKPQEDAICVEPNIEDAYLYSLLYDRFSSNGENDM